MAQNNVLKVIEGTVAGLTLGVAAGLFLSSKKGKELKNNIVDVTASFYKYISPKIKKIEKMGEKEYKEFMRGAAEQFAKSKKISGKLAGELAKEVQQSWKHFSAHLGK